MRYPLVALTLAGLCATASANGRPPVTNGVFFKPGDNQSLYVRTTFGLLISHDDGCSFHWVCEKAVGYGGEFDPKYAITNDGTIFATTFTGLRVSRDQGCSWTTATSELPANDPNNLSTTWIDAIDLAPNGDVWVATADSAKPNDVYRSIDNGVSFAPMGLMSPTLWWKSIRIAPSDGTRIYATGYQVAPTGLAKVERSDNGGTSWTDKVLPDNVMYGPTPLFYVTTVDPTRPDHLFGYSSGATPPNGDRLYESTDGATTWNEILSTTDAIRGVVLRADGSVIVATLGGGTSMRAAGASTFTLLGSTVPNGPDPVPPHLGCLGQRPDGTLVGCGANWQPDYMAVGQGADPLAMHKLFRFVELAGPLTCPAGSTSATECDPQWPALQQQFGATGPTATCAAPADAGPPPALPKASTDDGGCCNASTVAAPGALLLACGVGLLLSRRRKKPCCD
ncbi:MAG TPA: sialidase family protein [Kofleriaceae bacterium]|jgi:hypothetical protein